MFQKTILRLKERLQCHNKITKNIDQFNISNFYQEVVK